MRAVRTGAILLILTVLTVIINSLVLRGIISDITDEIISAEESDAAIAEAEYTKIFEHYKSRALYISLTVNHEDLTDIENSFSEIIGASKAGDMDAVITAKSRLISALMHLGRLAGINLDSIF